MPTDTVTPAAVRAMLQDGAEMALLDVREEGVFSDDGHPFFANSVPLSRLELLIRQRVPRFATRIVVCDGGDDQLATRAAAKPNSFALESTSLFSKPSFFEMS